ncbi:MAG: hypothetical protein M1834_003837 [Cirrosporium novae-zelandiae]|nr:MAG: hypothetical protein M1834_003837 [Cirrosporium novae-zelandiae]
MPWMRAETMASMDIQFKKKPCLWDMPAPSTLPVAPGATTTRHLHPAHMQIIPIPVIQVGGRHFGTPRPDADKEIHRITSTLKTIQNEQARPNRGWLEALLVATSATGSMFCSLP